MKSLAGLFLMVLGFLGHTYFSRYKGELIDNPFLLNIFSWLIFGLGILFFYMALRGRLETISHERNQWINYLLTNGEKIPVDFFNCEIKENSFIESADRNISKSEAYGETYKAIFNEPEYSPTEQSRYTAVLSFKYDNPKTGSIEIFLSETISKDKITLSFLLEEKKSTYIYVDRNDRRKYFFDLDFLR